MVGNNWLALGITLVFALVWLRINDLAAQKGWIGSQLSRKIIHIGTGPLFVCCWLLFTTDFSARFIAAVVPLIISIQFFLVGIGKIKDQGAVDGMSRSGDPREILRGPLYYGIVFVLVTVFFWYDSPIGVTALMLLCGGDGLADIIGKRTRTAALPWSKDKTWGGTMAMFFGGWFFSLFVIEIFILAGKFPGNLLEYMGPISIISVIGALVESLPTKDYDNLTVPGAAVLLGFILLK